MAYTYDPNQITAIVGGKIVTGWSQDAMVSVSYNADAFSYQANADGGGTRVKSNDRSGRYTFVLQQSSPSNDDFMAIALADRLTNAGIVPILLRDASGRSLYSSAQNWVVKEADGEFAHGLSNRTWIFETDELASFTGGNN